MKARRSLMVLLILVLAVVGAGSLWVWRAKRQYALNRQLIAALLHNDDKTALALVNEGADPNTREDAPPALTLPELCRQLLHRSPPPANDSATAFLLACGSLFPIGDDGAKPLNSLANNVPLVQAMLAHGANVRAMNELEQTVLHVAVSYDHPQIVELLLDHGANVNALDNDGDTPLMDAVLADDENSVRRLLEHGANVTIAHRGGDTALHFVLQLHANPHIIGLLVAHGADPNARNERDDTPLRLAQQYHRPDLVRLLRGGR